MSPRRARLGAATALLLSILALVVWSLLAPADEARPTPRPGHGTPPPAAPIPVGTPDDVATIASIPSAASPTPGTFAIDGSVTLDGAPLPGVPVRLLPIAPPGAEVRVRTDAAGRFNPSLASGEWEVAVEHGRGARVTSERPRDVVLVGGARPAEILIEREDGTTQVDPPRASVVLFTARDLGGQVVDSHSGRGVPGAIVSVDDRQSSVGQATTDANGCFELVLPGPAVRRADGVSLHVLARAPGYGAGGVQLRRFLAGQSLDPDTPLAPLRITLEPGLTLRGVVTDLQGAPVRASVRARSTSRDALVEVDWSLETAPDGSFVLDHVPTGSRSGPMFEQETPGLTLGPAHGSVALKVEAAGFAVERVPAAAAGPGAETTHVRLRALAQVDGVVLGPDGAPLAGALVASSKDLAQLVGELSMPRIARWMDPHPPMGLARGRTARDGQFLLSTSEGTRWLLVLARGCAPRLVALSPPVTGAVLRLDPSTGSIEGTLQGHDGRAARERPRISACVPGADVPSPPALVLARGDLQVIDLASIPGAVVAEAFVGWDCAFAIEDVPPGAYELRVWAHDQRLGTGSGLVRPGETTAVSMRGRGRIVVAHMGELSWVVVSAGGAPVARATGVSIMVPAGDAEVAVFAKGHAPAVTRVTAVADRVVIAPVTLSPGGADLALEFAYPARPVEALQLRWRDPVVDVERTLQLPAVPGCTLDGVSLGRFDLRITVHERVAGALRAREVVVPLRAPIAGPQVVDLR